MAWDTSSRVSKRRANWFGQLPLTRRIFAVNLLTIVLLACGVLYLDAFRNQLSEERLGLIHREADMSASVLAATPPAARDSVLLSLARSTGSRIRLFGPDGSLRKDSWKATGPTYSSPRSDNSEVEQGRRQSPGPRVQRARRGQAARRLRGAGRRPAPGLVGGSPCAEDPSDRDHGPECARPDACLLGRCSRWRPDRASDDQRPRLHPDRPQPAAVALRSDGHCRPPVGSAVLLPRPHDRAPAAEDRACSASRAAWAAPAK